jgi:hypothetical protein
VQMRKAANRVLNHPIRSNVDLDCKIGDSTFGAALRKVF